MSEHLEFDFLIVGSGFGGSVSAMRLAQKGYSVGILEMGRELEEEDFPKSNWNIFKYLWAPIIRCFGPQKITFLKGVMVLHGTGVGGGSLVYANTLMRPHDDVFKSGMWPAQKNWAQELDEHYQMAKKMLGVIRNPHLDEGELALKEVAQHLGIENTFHPTDVGIYFAPTNQAAEDPYFSGDGPLRAGCNLCGGCMIGCRHNAKNTLPKNYLYFARKWGAKIFPETKATKILPLNDGSYLIETVSTTAWLKKSGPRFKAKKVILAAGVLGTLDLLLKNKEDGHLRDITDFLGHTVRTNGESLLGSTSFEKHRNLSRGIAIGAAIHPDQETKIESVRYPAGSGLMRFLAVPLTGDGTIITRPIKMLGLLFKDFFKWIRIWAIADWAKSTLILLVMQSTDNKMRLKRGRSLLTGFRKAIVGSVEKDPVPSYLPIAQVAAQELSMIIGGYPQNVISEVVLKTPATAHILGGACMGATPADGVVDFNHQVFNYPGLYVCDASVIPSNLGVNPSLTISALAEHFSSHFPIKEGAVLQKIHFSNS